MTFSFPLFKQDNGLSMTRSSLSRRKLFKHLGVAAAAAALTPGLQAFSLSRDAQASSGQVQDTRMTSGGKLSGTNVVLVHGAFVDASSWSYVTPVLQRAGHQVLAVQLPLTSLADDIDVTRQALTSLSGPTVLVGHSYGGAVITGAGTASNVVSLVYVAAYALAQGESAIDLSGRYPKTLGAKHFIPSYRKGFVWLDPAFFPQAFVADIDPARARVLAVAQKPIVEANFSEKAGPAAWQHLPSWYLVSANDMTINPDLERWMAKRIHATTREIPSSHASPVSHPLDVAQVILEAAKVGKRG